MINDADQINPFPLSAATANGQVGAPAGAGPVAPAGHTKSKQGSPDVLMLAYLYLVIAANCSADTALTKAKELKANGLEQQNLNNDISALKWVTVSEQKVQHNHHGTWVLPHWWSHWTYKTWWTTQFLNKTQIAEQQSQNQQVFAERGAIQDQLTVLQQNASIGQTNVSTQTQESVQSMQESSSLLDMVQNLTFKALLHQPPAGS